MTAIPNAAVVSNRQRKRDPHPLDPQFAAAGLDRYLLDDFPTQPWAARAWCEHVENPAHLATQTAWEPTANRGFLELAIRPYFGRLWCSDIFDYGLHFPVYNFLDLNTPLLRFPDFIGERPDWIITNPPFARALEFILLAIKLAGVGVAMLTRTAILETVGRFNELFSQLGLRWAWSQFVERCPMVEGGMAKKQDTMTSYGWLTIWHEPRTPAQIVAVRHIPPCRDRLERADDYVWRTPYHPPVTVKKKKAKTPELVA